MYDMVSIMAHVQRTLPYVKALRRIQSPKQRQTLFKNMPKFVVDDIAEIIYNIIIGSAHISPKYKQRLGKVRHQLYKIIKSPTTTDRRTALYKQSGGGIFTILLPALATVISSIIAATKKND